MGGSGSDLDTDLILFSQGLSFSTSKMGLISLPCYFTSEQQSQGWVDKQLINSDVLSISLQ